MPDPQAAHATQLKNIQLKTGQTIPQLHTALAAAGLARHAEKRGWLMETFKLGYGDANAVVHFVDKPLPDLGDGAASSAPPANVAPVAGDPLDAIYTGAKAGLRPLHDAIVTVVAGFGDFEQAPKKSYLSLRRKKQFAMVGPATKDAIEIGLNAKDLPSHARLKVVPPGGMCQATMRIGGTGEINAELEGWLRKAFNGAG